MLFTKQPGQSLQQWKKLDPIVAYTVESPCEGVINEKLEESAAKIREEIKRTGGEEGGVCLDCAESQGLTDKLFPIYLHETDLFGMVESDYDLSPEAGIEMCIFCGLAVYVDLRPSLYLIAGGEKWMNRFRAEFSRTRQALEIAQE